MAISTTINAQTTTNFGLEAGATSSKLRSIDFSGDENNTFTADGGFYFGALAHLNKANPFSVKLGLRYAQVSGKEKTTYNSLPGLTVNGTVMMNYLEIPIQFTFNKQSGKCQKLFAYFGPQFNVGLSGTKKATITGLPNIDEKIKFGKKVDEIKKFNFYIGAGVGYKASKNVNFTLGSTFGASDIDNSKDYETKFNSLRIGLQYIF
jgi:opacity protein-like surface antigen